MYINVYLMDNFLISVSIYILYTHICMYAYIYFKLYKFIHAHTDLKVANEKYICMYTYFYVFMYIYIYVHIYIYIDIYTLNICVYIYIYILT
jgi:hypothetical protein